MIIVFSSLLFHLATQEASHSKWSQVAGTYLNIFLNATKPKQ
jgi:hypothetical protein